MDASSATGGAKGAIPSPPSGASSPRARPCPFPTEARSATWPTNSAASPSRGAAARRRHPTCRSPSSPATTRCSPTTGAARSTRSCAPSRRARASRGSGASPPPPPRRPGRDAPHQGHAPTRRRPRARRRPRRGAGGGRERAGRARDDRRPRAERPRTGGGGRVGRGRGVRARREPPDGASSGVLGRRPGAAGSRSRPAFARDLPGRLDHRRAQGTRHGDHPRARAGPARRVHRRLRPLPPEWRPRARPRHPHGAGIERRRPLPRRWRHRGRLGPRARARRGVAQNGRAAPRPRRGRASRAGAVLVWLNGRFLPARDARVSALDRGLLHGDGVYDTWRTYGGLPFATAAHLRRLAGAARALGLPAPGPARGWERRARLLVARAGLADAAVRLTVTRGVAGEGLAPERRARPTLLLSARQLPAHLEPRRREGIPVVLLPFPRDAGAPWGGLKLVGHPSAVVGRVTASRRGAAEGLYVTAAAEVTEATSANVFLVERGALVTPPRDAGILPGVTRALVIALARRAGLRCARSVSR